VAAFASRGRVDKPGHCKWCGIRLPRTWRYCEPPTVWTWNDWADRDRPFVEPNLKTVRVGARPEVAGYLGDGHFCSLSCGYFFGRWHADHGNVLIVKNKVGKDG
jgi:hypothetical protein